MKPNRKIIPLTAPLKNTQIIEVLTNPQAHPTQAQYKAVKTSKARQKIHSWLAENDPTFIDKDALERREAEIAANTLHSKQVAEKLREEKKKKNVSQKTDYTGRVVIENTTNFLVTMAQCCKPKPGDPIVGYISRNRGITVHAANCLTFLRIPDIEKRSVPVEWDTTERKKSKKETELREQNKEKSKQRQIEMNRFKKQR